MTPLNNRIADLAPSVVEWRRHIHAHPELRYEETETAAFVAERLRSFGVDEVVEGIGRTGVVGVIRGEGESDAVVALRCDMDALPIEEATGVPYASTKPGIMHACGHDGHTAMLLGAAQYLAETRNFAGTVVLVFQPAEEGGAGAKAMIDDGLLDRFGIARVFGLHNYPGMPAGGFGICPGPMMAAADRIEIEITGKGAHAARPHWGRDVVLAGAAIVQGVQQVVSRNLDPLESCVVSITMFNAGYTDNVLPQQATLKGTVRSLRGHVRDMAEVRLHEVVEATGKAHGVEARLTYRRDYPVTANDAAEAGFCAGIARDLVGEDAVEDAITPVMGGEDFSFMLEQRPGAMIFLGNGDSAGLHNPNYDFNDDIIPFGISYWARLVETTMPRAAA